MANCKHKWKTVNKKQQIYKCRLCDVYMENGVEIEHPVVEEIIFKAEKGKYEGAEIIVDEPGIVDIMLPEKYVEEVEPDYSIEEDTVYLDAEEIPREEDILFNIPADILDFMKFMKFIGVPFEKGGYAPKKESSKGIIEVPLIADNISDDDVEEISKKTREDFEIGHKKVMEKRTLRGEDIKGAWIDGVPVEVTEFKLIDRIKII